ncbi:MAG: hypothetical protein FWE50_01305 [Alphaproteobacteria bacterium]|nr:hypothetical protein [Alphaproteobacteria bacterium]
MFRKSVTIPAAAIKVKGRDIPIEMKKWFDVKFADHGIALKKVCIMPISKDAPHAGDIATDLVYDKYGTKYAISLGWMKKNRKGRPVYPMKYLKNVQDSLVWIIINNLRKEDGEEVVNPQKYLDELNFLFKMRSWLPGVVYPVVKEALKVK